MPATTVDPIHVPINVFTTAGTLRSAPLTSTFQLPHGTIEAVDLVIPPGHLGVTGIAILMSQAIVLPWSLGAAWIVGNDLRETFPLDVDVTDVLQLRTYNEGHYDHTHYLRFRIRQLAQSQGIPTLRAVDLSGGGAA